jgi:hypothetical protein
MYVYMWYVHVFNVCTCLRICVCARGGDESIIKGFHAHKRTIVLCGLASAYLLFPYTRSSE